MRRREGKYFLAWAVLALPILVSPGCRTMPGWTLKGKLPSRPFELGGGEGREAWGALTLDELGNMSLNGQVLALPSAVEHSRFGVSLLDASALPRPWRPRHAAEGGVLVAALERPSPLALAGLRPFDVVRSVNGEPVTRPEVLARRLGEVAPGERLRLEAETPRGPQVFDVEAGEALLDSTFLGWIPIFGYQKTGTQTRFSFFLLFSFWRWIRDRRLEAEDPALPWPIYDEGIAWDLVFDLVQYRSWRNLYSEERKRSLVILWFLKIRE